VVYNPATMERLATEVNATHVGAEMDPSHLFWQGIDPIAALDRLGGLVYNAAAKDTRINPPLGSTACSTTASGECSPVRPMRSPSAVATRLSRWPEDSSWDFVAVGRGHDVAFWSQFLQALHKIDPDMAVNIEHEDREFDQLEGLRTAAETLLEAARELYKTGSGLLG
jgi:sugar phosphate isomerase/epimerase